MGNIRGGTLGFHGTIGQPTAQVIDGSLSFQRGSSTHLSRTPSSAGNSKTFTFSCWYKKTNPSASGVYQAIFDANNASDYTTLYTDDGGTDALRLYVRTGGTNYNLKTSQVLRDYSAWTSIIFSVDTTQSTAADRIKMYINGTQVTDFSLASYPPQNSDLSVNKTNAHFIGGRSGQSAFYLNGYLANIHLIDGQALGPEYFGFTDPLTNTWRPRKAKTDGPNVGTTWSSVSTISSGGAASGKPLSNGFDGSTGTAFEGDTTGATVTVPVSATIVKGGVKVYAAVTSGNPLVVLLKNGGTTVETINAGASGGQFYSSSTYSGPITSLVISRTGRAPEFNAIGINGIILKDDSTTNLDFGTNGFYLPLDNQDDFEVDKSGNGNDFSKSNFSGTFNDPNVLKDSPSGAVFGGRAQTGITTTSSAPANYCTLNPLDKNSDITLSNGNLDAVSSSVWKNVRATMSVTSGKYYFELFNPSGDFYTGIADHTLANDTGSPSSESIVSINQNGFISQNSATYNSYGSSDVVGVTLDADIKKVTFYKNGSVNDANSNHTYTTSNPVFPFVALNSSNADMNFGQKPFKYAPPKGFLPLNSATVRPNKVIPRPDQYVGVTTYTGTNASNHAIDVGLKPDLVWIKSRAATRNHRLTDTVRGAGKEIYSDITNSEGTVTDGVTSFNDKGFVLGANNNYNYTEAYVAWCWKAGGAPTATNNNTSGAMDANSVSVDGVLQSSYTPSGSPTIYPTDMSVGTNQGFSIIRYQANSTAGATIPHGLSQAPTFVLVKSLETAGSANSDWTVFHSTLGGTKAMYLNEQDGSNSTGSWNDTNPNANVITLGTAHVSNLSPNHYIAYAWHDVPGLQKFGSYTYTGNKPFFVELGFKPAILWLKRTGSGSATNISYGSWFVADKERGKFNPISYTESLYLNRNYTSGKRGQGDAAGTYLDIDFVSNGFVIPTTGGGAEFNQPNDVVIYCAWAEAPASNLFGGQSNAR